MTTRFKDVKKKPFRYSKKAERDFYRALKKVAEASGHIVDQYTRGAEIINGRALQETLIQYSKTIEPWARRQAAIMIQQVSKNNIKDIKSHSKNLAKLLRSEVLESGEGQIAMALINEQVGLIKSIPIEAGLRAQKIAAESFIAGNRAVPDVETIKYLQKEMGMSTEVAINRAKLIARTETARANAAFMQSRAEDLGAEGYIWRATMDGATRESHKEMNGKFVRYDTPPTLSDGTVTHAGMIYNCRCWQEPILPDLD